MSSLYRHALIAATVLFTLSCSDSTALPEPDLAGETEQDEATALQTYPEAMEVISAVPVACGEPTVTALMLGSNFQTGTIEVANDETNLFVTFHSDHDRPILATAVFVGDSPDEIPTSRYGTPRLLRFPYKSGHPLGTTEVTWQIPLEEVSGPDAVIAAFAQVGFWPSWGAGEPINPDFGLAMYFTHTMSPCSTGTVGPEGGEVSSPSGEATIQIPAGALTGPVDITIEPATYQNLLDHIANRSVAPGAAAAAVALDPLPSMEGLTPIANTIWDFGPDGLEFQTPSTVTLAYDDAQIPDGVQEEELGVFVINGVIPFDRLPSIVDPVANTVTAPAYHFSFYFIGYLDIQSTDLAVTGTTAVNDGLPIGTEVEYAATVANFGPGYVSGVQVVYDITGAVLPGPLTEGCVEEPDPAPADLALRCEVGSISANQGAGAPAAVFTVEGAGTVEVTVTPEFPGVDIDPANDSFEDSFRVGPLADLGVAATVSNDGEPAGVEVRYTPFVENNGPESVDGASIAYQAFGGVVAGSIDDGCVETPNPIFGDVYIRCEVGPVTANHAAAAPEASFVAQSPGEYEVWITVFFEGTDPDPENDRYTHTFTALDATPAADLTVTGLVESADPIELGQSVEYTATVENLGPDDVTEAVVYYIGFGNVEVGSLSEGCTEVPLPPVGQAEIQCPVGALGSGASAQAPSGSFVPGSTGDFTVWSSPGSEGTDPDIDNNRFEESFTVISPQADLYLQNLNDDPDPVPAGGNAVYSMQVGLDPAAAQSVEGAKLTLNPSGDASFVSSSEDGCNETPVGIVCPLPTLVPGATHDAQVTLAPNFGVTELTVVVSVNAPVGVVDPDHSNNSLPETTTVGASSGADLTVSELTESADPIGVDGSVTYQATLQNLGPDAVADAAAIYRIIGFSAGDVEAGPLEPGCNASAIGSTFLIICPIGPVGAGDEVAAAPATFVLRTPGEFTVQADPFSGTPDPDPTNNQFQTTLTVNTLMADLRVDRLEDTPDPLPSGGGDVTYEVDVIAAGATAPVEGARLDLRFNGSFSLMSSTHSCDPIIGGLRCALGTLQPDVVSTEQFVVTLSAAGQFTVTAEILAPLGGAPDDPDPTNNSMTETTMVGSGGNFISVGQVLEVQGPTVVSGQPPDTVWYSFETMTPGLDRRIHLSRITDVNGYGQLLLFSGSDQLFPSTAEGRTDLRSSANELVHLGPVGNYRLGIAGSSGTYRLGLGTGVPRLDEPYGTRGSGVILGDYPSDFEEMQLLGDDVVLVGWDAVMRYDETGVLDASFGTGGEVDLPTVLGAGGTGLRIQPDGKVVVVARSGLSPYPWVVARFNGNGSLDPTFGTGGIVEVSPGGTRSGATPVGIRFQQNGADLDIVVVGEAGDLQNKVGIVRLDPDGGLDTGFGVGGKVFENQGMTPIAMDIQSDGKILVQGLSEVLRYNADGTLDGSFATNGRWNLPISTQIRGIQVLPDDDILVMGELSEDAFIYRLTPDGAYDGTFAGGGMATYDFGLKDRFIAATQDASGRLIVVGHQRTPQDWTEFLVVRMFGDGTLDQSFGHGGYVLEHRVDEAQDVEIDTQGRLLIGGEAVDGSDERIHLTRHIMN